MEGKFKEVFEIIDLVNGKILFLHKYIFPFIEKGKKKSFFRYTYIFIGVEEVSSKETRLLGISNNEIYTQEFIDQILFDGLIQPSISGVKLHKIRYNEKYYIILEIPESKTAPHFFRNRIPFRFSKISDLVRIFEIFRTYNFFA